MRKPVLLHPASMCLLAILLTSCVGSDDANNEPAPGNHSSAGNTDNGQPVGPCAYFYDDPIVTLQSAKVSSRDKTLAGFHIAEIKRSGKTLNFHSQVTENPVNLSIDSDGIGGYCTLPCGFSYLPGDYTVTIDEPDYKTVTIEFPAKYHRTENGCPGLLSNGTLINLTLELENSIALDAE